MSVKPLKYIPRGSVECGRKAWAPKVCPVCQHKPKRPARDVFELMMAVAYGGLSVFPAFNHMGIVRWYWHCNHCRFTDILYDETPLFKFIDRAGSFEGDKFKIPLNLR